MELVTYFIKITYAAFSIDKVLFIPYVRVVVVYITALKRYIYIGVVYYNLK